MARKVAQRHIFVWVLWNSICQCCSTSATFSYFVYNQQYIILAVNGIIKFCWHELPYVGLVCLWIFNINSRAVHVRWEVIVAVNVNVNFWGTMSCSLIKRSLQFWWPAACIFTVEDMYCENGGGSSETCYIVPDSCHHIPEDCIVDVF